MLNQIGEEIAVALQNGKDSKANNKKLSDCLEMDSGDALAIAFRNVLKQSLGTVYNASNGTPQNTNMQALCEYGELPIHISGLKTKKNLVAAKVKKILSEIEVETHDDNGIKDGEGGRDEIGGDKEQEDGTDGPAAKRARFN